MEIIPGVHAIPGTSLSRMYLIEDEHELALVDTDAPWSAQRVFRYIESIGRRPSEVRSILMTHSHPDHTGGVVALRRDSGANVAAHPGDAKPHNAGGHGLKYMGVFNAFDARLPFLQHAPVDLLLADGDIIPIAGGIRVIHTPGHTPGSVCYLLERRGLLFSGDTIFSNGRRISRSMPFPGSDLTAYQRSLERLASMEFDMLCGGHGLPMLGGAAAMLRELMDTHPELPTWWKFVFKRVPSRLLRGKTIHGEDY